MDLKVQGGARLLGFGSSLGKTDEVFDKPFHNAHRGRALAVFGAGNEAGITEVRVSSAGVEPVMFTLQTI